MTGYFDARLSGFRCLSPAPPHPFLTGYFDARLSGSRSSLPLRRVFSWPAILTPGYPVSGASLPLRLTLFDRLFWRPAIRFSFLSPAPPRLLLTGYFTARISGFRCPGTFFSLPVFGRLFRRPPFSHPTFPSRLFGWPARSLCRLPVGLRFLPPRGFYRSAVFTAPRILPLPRFLPLRDFSAPLSPVLWGALLFLSALQSSPSSGRILCYRLLRRVSGGTPFLIFFLDHLLNRSRSVTAHLTGFPFVPFIHIRGSSVVSSSDWRDTGTTCTTTSLMGPFGYRKLGNLTYHRLL